MSAEDQPVESEGIEGDVAEQTTIGLEKCLICDLIIYYTEGGLCWEHQDLAQLRRAVRGGGSSDPKHSDWPYSRWTDDVRMTTPLDELGIVPALVSPQVILRDLVWREMQRAPRHWRLDDESYNQGE